MGLTEKSVLGKGSQKTNMSLHKKGAWIVWIFKGVWQEQGGGIFDEGDTQMHTLAAQWCQESWRSGNVAKKTICLQKKKLRLYCLKSFGGESF